MRRAYFLSLGGRSDGEAALILRLHDEYSSIPHQACKKLKESSRVMARLWNGQMRRAATRGQERRCAVTCWWPL